jgi:GNAT superfamily N-acetyltransferase
MVQDDRQLTIRETEEDEEFAAWLNDLTERYSSGPRDDVLEERHLVLADEIGDWIGGLRWTLRGGVAQLIDIGVVPRERHQGHAHRLLAAFEERATEHGAHLLEFWTDHVAEEGLLGALGWARVMRREGYIGGREWYLLERRIAPAT